MDADAELEEWRLQAILELGGTNLESQFAALESGSDVDDELAMMKAQLSGRSDFDSGRSYSDSIVDAELEELRSQLKDL